MKLFTKTLLCFAGAIAFQSMLSILVITRVTERANLADARRELEDEGSILYDSLHAWKRQIWIALNTAARRPIDAVGAGEPERSLRELSLSARMDVAALASPGAPCLLVADPAGAAEEALGLRLVARRDHPYLELMLVHETLFLVGSVSVTVKGGAPADLFLAKRLDSEFLAQLALNRRSHAALFLGDRYLAGSLAAPPPGGVFEPREVRGSILERYDVRVDHSRFNVSWQRIGSLNGSGELFFATLLSNAPFNERLDLLDRTVLAISVASGLLTIAASLLLSRNITRPIADLHAAMARLHSGVFDISVPVRGGGEIARLSEGFNEMAGELTRGRRQLSESLAETLRLKEYNEKIVNSIRGGIAIVDDGLVVESANAGFLTAFGLDDAVGKPLIGLGVDIMDESLAAAVRAVIERRSTSWTGQKRTAGGRLFEIRLYPFAAAASAHGADGCVILSEDVTARAELEEKIMRAEKLSSISVLSAGMAHEINNPLGSILSNAQNLLADERDAGRRVALRWIEQETRRIARVVAELLHFAAAGGPAGAGADVNAAVDDAIRLLRLSGACGERVRVDARLAPDLPQTRLSLDEVSQVALNLLRNSLQAIQGPGRVLVRTRLCGCDGTISLSVADTGAGIPADVLPRIFDPFFTTKPTGEGTGLGLSVVYGIVTKYNGTIGVRSRPGGGTRVRLGLPVAAGGQP